MVAYCILILCCLGGESESESESESENYSRGRNLESITVGTSFLLSLPRAFDRWSGNRLHE